MNERRLDATTGEWTTFSTARQDRTFLPAAGACPLCPGDEATSEVGDGEFDVAVFDNRFPSFLAHPPAPSTPSMPAEPVAPAVGAAEVVVYSPDHRRALTDMPAARIAGVIDVWAERYADLAGRDDIAYVLIFENRGVEMGVTLHHPHGQIYAFPEIPPRVRAEIDAAAAHLERTERCVFCDVVAAERADAVRVLVQNESFIAFVPFAARFPYEVHVLSRRHATTLLDLTTSERLALAKILRTVLRGYDGLFGFPMPYVMAMHQAPTRRADLLAVSHLHLEYTPPYRSADRLKYIAGSELGAGAFMNDRDPEETAAGLRAAIAATG